MHIDTYKNYIDFETDDKNNIHKISINRESIKKPWMVLVIIFMASSKSMNLKK